jgi:PAS domain S-box-containing protein
MAVDSAEISRAIRRLRRALSEINRRSERHEHAQRARAQAVIDELASIPAAILVADDRGRYVDANRLATRLTGYSRDELLSMAVWDLTPSVRQGLGRRLWREFRERGRMGGVYRLRKKSGRVMSVRYLAIANVLQGVHVSALFVARPKSTGARKPTRPSKPSAGRARRSSRARHPRAESD